MISRSHNQPTEDEKKKMKTITKFVYLGFVAIALGCFALSPRAQAVSPAPDGAYAGANTAEGGNALLSLTTGINNTALGIATLLSDTTGSYNTATGALALRNNNGNGNTADGFEALFSN